MLDTVRYALALLVLLTFPYALLFWLIVHPFIDFWRRRGPAFTYWSLFAGFLVVAVLTWRARGELLAVEFGTGPALWTAAAVAYAIAIWVEIACRRHLKFRILVGMPELSPEPESGTLLTEGIYGHVRHPRYLSILFVTLAVALFCNYLAVWVMAVSFVPGLLLVIHFEERELLRRFGGAYQRYRREVPRLLPRPGRASDGSKRVR